MSRREPDHILVGAILLISVIGLVMLSSASIVEGQNNFNDPYYYFKHQLVFGFLPGIILLIIFSRINYQLLKKISLPLFIGSILLLAALLMPEVGFIHAGARRWINILGFSFQPSEIAKLTFLLYLATLFAKREAREIKNFSSGFLPFLILLGLMVTLIVLQPDLGTLSVIIIMSVAVYFVSGARLSHISSLIFIALVLFAGLIKLAPYRAARITTFFNPSYDPLGIGYHIQQALIAIGSGGILGLGLGNSRAKYQYLPEVTGDSIFAVIAEELGFILSSLIIILFLILIYRGFKIARNTKDIFGKLLASGITAWIGYQAFVNMGAVVHMLPLTGVPLPLISYGGTSLVVTLAALGILINISKHTSV